MRPGKELLAWHAILRMLTVHILYVIGPRLHLKKRDCLSHHGTPEPQKSAARCERCGCLRFGVWPLARGAGRPLAAQDARVATRGRMQCSAAGAP